MDPALLTEFATVVIALVIVIDPIGLLPVVVALRAHIAESDARRMLLKIVGGATVLLLLFTAAGTWLLSIFGVTINDLRIGGGLLLLIIALRMVLEGRIHSGDDEEYQGVIVPLISPLLVGPGAITAAVVLAAIHGVLMTSLAAIVAMLISLILLLATGPIYRVLGKFGGDLISRVMGVLIAAIAVGYIRTGVMDLIRKY